MRCGQKRASGNRGELVVLVERAVGHVVKVILNADDSNGQIGSLARDLLDVHVEVCDTGVADPVALAKWMVRFTFDDQDFFVVDPVRYAPRSARPGSPPTAPRWPSARPDRYKGSDRSRRSYAIERLAIIDRDVPTLVEVLGGDLTRPHQFSRVAEAMLELDDPDAALAWARRGIGETSGWQVAKLYDIAATIVAERGDNSGVFDLRLHQHERLPSASTYSLLKTAAEYDWKLGERTVGGSARARAALTERIRRRSPR